MDKSGTLGGCRGANRYKPERSIAITTAEAITAAATPRVNPASGYRCTSFKALKIDYRDGVLIKNSWIPVLEILPQFLPSLKSLVHRILVC